MPYSVVYDVYHKHHFSHNYIHDKKLSIGESGYRFLIRMLNKKSENLPSAEDLLLDPWINDMGHLPTSIIMTPILVGKQMLGPILN